MRELTTFELDVVCGGSWTGYSAGNSWVGGLGAAAGAAANAGSSVGAFIRGFAHGFYAAF